jgi:hypothetical protein
MSQTLLYSAPHLDIEYYEQPDYWYYNWKGLQTAESVFAGGEKIYEFFAQKPCGRVLNDNRLVVTSWYGATEWAGREWFPRMFAAGLTRFAWLVPEALFAEMSMQRALEVIPPEFPKVRTFDDVDQARQWLLDDSRS